ncbi:MAG: hypothetical protein C4527_04620 [Candidatus Omnitrophota bacterium]|jgi:hypothetical protein|nr:MAG: hypothetical protein C4527_04620 [Candidatus Omnitrophota bacterium]
MLIWVFVAVVVGASVTIQFIISSFVMGLGGVKLQIYPPWLIELHLSFFWFSYVFSCLRRRFFDVTKKNVYKFNMRKLLGNLFFAHLVAANLLRFALGQGILVSYVGSLIGTIVIPLMAAFLIQPMLEKHAAKPRIRGADMKEIALQSATVKKFLSQFPQCKAFVFENENRHDVGTCIFLHRRIRPERNDIFEDVLVEIPIDLKKRMPLQGTEKYRRYIFALAEEGSCVLDLPCEGILERTILDTPLETFDLERFDSLLVRFPSLRDVPLPVAVREEGDYETV